MERDGSGVSALVGLDEFVVTAQLLDDGRGVSALVAARRRFHSDGHAGAATAWVSSARLTTSPENTASAVVH